MDAIKGLRVSYNEFVADQVLELKGDRVYAYTRSMIKWHKEHGHLVIFISGSPDFLVSRMSKRFNADDFCGSIYHIENEKLSGKITPMWASANKLEAIDNFKKKYGINLEKSYAYGDTHGDLSMLQLVGHPRAINPSKELLNSIRENEELFEKSEIFIERKDVVYRVNAHVDILDI